MRWTSGRSQQVLRTSSCSCPCRRSATEWYRARSIPVICSSTHGNGRVPRQYIAVALIGSPEDRVAFRAAVDGVHRHVKSEPGSRVPYDAFDVDFQMWVAACLFVGLEDAYQLLRGEMTQAPAEQFYESARPLGTTLQVTDDQWPVTRAEFDAYWIAGCARVSIDDTVRRYLLTSSV